MSYEGSATCDRCRRTLNYAMTSSFPRAMDHRYFEGYMHGIGWDHWMNGTVEHWVCPGCKASDGGVQTAGRR